MKSDRTKETRWTQKERQTNSQSQFYLELSILISQQLTEQLDKFSKDIEPDYTTDQEDLIDIYRTLHPTTEEYILFSNAHGVLTKRDHTLVIKQNLLNVKEMK